MNKPSEGALGGRVMLEPRFPRPRLMFAVAACIAAIVTCFTYFGSSWITSFVPEEDVVGIWVTLVSVHALGAGFLTACWLGATTAASFQQCYLTTLLAGFISFLGLVFVGMWWMFLLAPLVFLGYSMVGVLGCAIGFGVSGPVWRIRRARQAD